MAAKKTAPVKATAKTKGVKSTKVYPPTYNTPAALVKAKGASDGKFPRGMTFEIDSGGDITFSAKGYTVASFPLAEWATFITVNRLGFRRVK